MPLLPRSFAVACLVLAAMGSPAAAQQAKPVYVKVDLDRRLLDLQDQVVQQFLKGIGQEIIDAIKGRGYSRQYSWDLRATEPADRRQFPEVRIHVKPNTQVSNWYMQVIVRTGNGRADAVIELPAKQLLQPGDVESGLFPLGSGLREKVRDWFMDHYVKIIDRDSLHHTLSTFVPLGEGRLGPDCQAIPPLPEGQAVLLLPYENYWHLGKSLFVIKINLQQQVLELEFEGLGGFRQITIGDRQFRGLTMRLLGNPQNQANGTKGVVHLRKFRHATLPTHEPLLLAD